MIPLYRTDPYLFVHQTIADAVQDDGETQLVICRELIFAEGGGQPPDHGSIFWEGSEQPVLEIVKEKGNSLLRISRIDGLKKGTLIECRLDPERRRKIMRLHSAQHGLAGALRQLEAGYQSNGMAIDEAASYCTMRFTCSSSVGAEKLEAAAEILHQAIKDDRAVRAEIFESTQAASSALGALLRPSDAQVVIRGRARVVIIEGLDANACGGTHVKSMGEVVGIDISEFDTRVGEISKVVFRLKSPESSSDLLPDHAEHS